MQNSAVAVAGLLGLTALVACVPNEPLVTRSFVSSSPVASVSPAPAPHDPSDVLSVFGGVFDVPDGCPQTPSAAEGDDQKKLERLSWMLDRSRLGSAGSGIVLDEVKRGNIALSIKMTEMMEVAAPNRTQQSFAAALTSLAYANAGNVRRARSKAGEAAALASDSNQYRLRLVALADITSREASGDFIGAEIAAKRAIDTLRRLSPSDEFIPIFWEQLAKALLAQARVNEAEAALRVAVAGRQYGGLSLDGISVAVVFSSIFLQRDLPGPALQMAKLAINKLETECITKTSLLYNDSLRAAARAHSALRDWNSVISTFEAIEKNLETIPDVYRRRYATDPLLAWAILKSGDSTRAISAAEAGMAAALQSLGPASPEYVRTRAIRALARAALSADKGELLTVHNEVLEGGAVNLGYGKDPFSKRFENEILRHHFRELIKADLREEAFSISDVLRGGAVQAAISNASARAATRDPRLQEVVRGEQDTAFQIEALSSILVNAASGVDVGRTPEQLRAEIQALRDQNARLRVAIDRDFRAYSNLIRPKAPSVQSVRTALGDREAFVSVAVEDDVTIVWTIAKTGDVMFHVARDWGAKRVKDVVAKLRLGLAPDISSISDVPAFDSGLAHELYAGLFAPVAPAWAASDTLIFSTTGALAEMPLHVLPTRPSARATPEQSSFAGYRDVAWLVRDKAVAHTSTAGSFVDLRALKAETSTPRSADRVPFAGFGDALFNARQLIEFNRDSQNTQLPMTRSAAVSLRSTSRDEDGRPWDARAPDGRFLRALSRLPETATEIRSIARELGASEESVYLGPRANEETVRRTNLSSSRVVMFATHGLMAGDLPGLHEPALAMTAPELTGTQGDGFLTMSEIMTLRLDADWVILSACNTAAGEGKGAESASGLGRAFFYAGARAVLLTHWAVESTSAEAITTRMFHHQSRDGNSSRAQAHRAAMLDVMASYASGRTPAERFSYAHPFFWAPFALMGDPGRPAR